MSEAADILRKAKELIETKGWTQNRFARNSSGTGLWDRETIAAHGVCFCLSGAILAQARADEDEQAALGFLRKAVGNDVPFFNDKVCYSKEEAVAKLDRAIALAESQS